MENDRADVQRRIEALTIAISVRSLPRIVEPLMGTTLTLQQLKALTAVVVGDVGATTSGLAASFAVSLATMSKLVDRLVAQGLVEKVADGEDQRVRRLSATQLGRDVVGRVIGARPELGKDVLDGLDPEELSHLEIGLRAINRELQQGDRRSDVG